MKFELVSLPYATDALAPVIGKSTIEFHHGKHLLAYVNNLNNLIPGTKFENADLETIVKESDGAIFNNAGQVLNHNLYFTQFSPNGGGKPSGELAKAIENQWGSFEEFQKEFVNGGVTLFGSGWVWLSKDKDGKLFITKEGNAGNPVTRLPCYPMGGRGPPQQRTSRRSGAAQFCPQLVTCLLSEKHGPETGGPQ